MLFVEFSLEPGALQIHEGNARGVFSSLKLFDSCLVYYRILGVSGMRQRLALLAWAAPGFRLFHLLLELPLLSCSHGLVRVREHHVESVNDLCLRFFRWDEWVSDVAKHTLSSPELSEVKHQSLLHGSEVVERVQHFDFVVSTLHVPQRVVRLHEVNRQVKNARLWVPCSLWRLHLAAAQGIASQGVGHLHIKVVVCFVNARCRDRLVDGLLVRLVLRIFIMLVEILLLLLMCLFTYRHLNLYPFGHFRHVALFFKDLLLPYQVQVDLRGFGNHQVDACQVVHIQKVESPAQQSVDRVALRI